MYFLQVDKWFVVLHGQLRMIRDSDSEKYYHIGESFGVSASLKVLPHRGKLVTATKDCQVCECIVHVYCRYWSQYIYSGTSLIRTVYGVQKLALVYKATSEIGTPL